MSKTKCDPFPDKEHKQSKFTHVDMSQSVFDAVDLTRWQVLSGDEEHTGFRL